MRRRRQPSGPPFVQLHMWLLGSPAWQDLSGNARAVYVEMKARYNGKNNGLLTMSTREAGDAINATNDTGSRALRELIEHGFLVVTEASSFVRKVGVARSFRLTEAADDRPGVTRLPTKDFMKWRPGVVFGDEAEIQKAVRRIGQSSPTHRTVGAENALKIA